MGEIRGPNARHHPDRALLLLAGPLDYQSHQLLKSIEARPLFSTITTRVFLKHASLSEHTNSMTEAYMTDETDPDTIRKLQELQERYGNLNRHDVGHGLTISAGDEFEAALERLGINQLPDFAVIPRNLLSAPTTDAFVYERESRDLQAIATGAGLKLAPLADGAFETIHENDASLILPALVFLYPLLETYNKTTTIVEFFNNMLKLLSRQSGKPLSQIELTQEILVKKNSKSMKFSYKGPAENYMAVVSELKQRFDEYDT